MSETNNPLVDALRENTAALNRFNDSMPYFLALSKKDQLLETMRKDENKSFQAALDFAKGLEG